MNTRNASPMNEEELRMRANTLLLMLDSLANGTSRLFKLLEMAEHLPEFKYDKETESPSLGLNALHVAAGVISELQNEIDVVYRAAEEMTVNKKAVVGTPIRVYQ